VQSAILLLTTYITVIDPLAPSAQLQLREEVFPLSTGSTCSRSIATSLVIPQAIPVTQSGSTESACLFSVRTTAITACCRSFYCCAEFHLFVAFCSLSAVTHIAFSKNLLTLFLLFCGVYKSTRTHGPNGIFGERNTSNAISDKFSYEITGTAARISTVGPLTI